MSRSSLFISALLAGLLLVPARATEASEPACADATPEGTWSQAAEAASNDDLVLLSSCMAPEARPELAFRLLSMAGQLVQMMGLTTAEEGSAEYAEDEKAVVEAAERLIEIQSGHGLPVTAEEAAAIDVAERESILAAIDYPQMTADLILFIESLDDSESAAHRSSYFTTGDFGEELTEIAIEEDTATAKAGGVVSMVRVEGAWYLLPAN